MEDHIEIGENYRDHFLLGKSHASITYTGFNAAKSYGIRLLCLAGDDAHVEFSSKNLAAEGIAVNFDVMLKYQLPSEPTLTINLTTESTVLVDVFELSTHETATRWSTKVIEKIGGRDTLHLVSAVSLLTLAIASLIF